MAEHVGKSLLNRKLIGSGAKVLIAVSGGLDSMALLDILYQLSKAHGWKLFVAHFNHQLRGQSSDADEECVRRMARRMGLRFMHGRGNVRKGSRMRGISLEMAARELRHAFLARAAGRIGARSIAFAHHADDQAELFLIRLLRGASAEGLAGMKWKSVSPAAPSVQIIRPLLDITKRELEDYASARKIAYRIDATNLHQGILRNRIRHRLVPFLIKNFQPALVRILNRQMEILGSEDEYLNNIATKWLNRGNESAFEDLPVAIQRRCLQLQLIQNGVPATYDLIEQIREVANRDVSLGGQRWISRNIGGKLKIRSKEAATFQRRQKQCILAGKSGEMIFGNTRFNWQLLKAGNGTFRAPKPAGGCEYFDADKVGTSVILRHWRPGDRFQPIGLPYLIKLQDLFVNQKVDRSMRRTLVVAEARGKGIFWVEGLRISEKFKLDKNTIHRLKWRWQRLL